MSELKLISPLLDNMEIERCIQSGGGTSVYLLRRTTTNQNYILKHISVPESQTQLDALRFTGAVETDEDAQRYFEQIIEDYNNEIDAQDMLRSSANFATYLAHQVCPKEEGIGYELYLLAEKWTTLIDYLERNAMTHLKALNLGLDLCTALIDLRTQGLIHRDIKPENIYLSGMNGFMLGDLGVAKIEQLKYTAMPERMITEYTAPEMSDIMNDFNTTIDIYSIGMVLYRILNGNHGPFEDEKTSPKAANKMRISGEPLPAPLYSDYELTEIILKACAFDPAERYQTPEELMQELVLYMKRNTVSDSLIVPPIVTDPSEIIAADSAEEEIEPVRFADVTEMDEEFVQNFSPDNENISTIIEEVHQQDSAPAKTTAPAKADEQEPAVSDESRHESEAADGETASFSAPHTQYADADDDMPDDTEAAIAPKKKRKKNKLLIPIIIAVILVAAIATSVYFIAFRGSALNIAEINVAEKGTDYLTVSIDTGGRTAALQLQCQDAYGNIQSLDYEGESVTFSGLASGAQYTINVVSAAGKKLSGMTSTMVTTVALTEIVSFTANSHLAGQVELTLLISGPDPGEWTVRYFADGVEPMETTFSGHSVSIFNLETNLTYTFELLQPEGIVFHGTSSLEFSSGPEIEILNLTADSLTKNSVAVVWECGENDPGEWSVTCTGTDGSTKTQTVQECRAEFTELMTGDTYTITVTSAGTLSPASISVTPTAATVEEISATTQDDGSVLLEWTADTGATVWRVNSTVSGTDLSTMQVVEGNSVTLSGLIPGKTYEFELRSELGEKLGGNTTAEASIPVAAKFDSYGASRFFLGTFLLPDKANWSGKDLAVSTAEFEKSEDIAFAVESLTGRTSSDDAIEIVYVVESATGVPVSTGTSGTTWDEMWVNDLFVGEIAATPQESGTYTIRLYFNGMSVASKEITIK